MKIRNKISLWIAAMTLTVGLFSGFYVYLEMSEESFEIIDRELLDLAERLLDHLATDKNILDSGSLPSMLDRHYIVVEEKNSGEVIYRSRLASLLELTNEKEENRFLREVEIAYDHLWIDPENIEDLDELEGTGVLFRVVRTPGAVGVEPCSVTIAKPLPFMTEELEEMRWHILTWSLSSALFVIIISYLLAGRILAPLALINRQIREINQNSLSSRIPLGASRDELNELGSNLNRMFDRLQYSFAKQREFIGNASHEIKTPITTLLIGYENLLSSPLDEDLRIELEKQFGVVQRISVLVKNLLDISRLEQQDMA